MAKAVEKKHRESATQTYRKAHGLPLHRAALGTAPVLPKNDADADAEDEYDVGFNQIVVGAVLQKNDVVVSIREQLHSIQSLAETLNINLTEIHHYLVGPPHKDADNSVYPATVPEILSWLTAQLQRANKVVASIKIAIGEPQMTKLN